MDFKRGNWNNYLLGIKDVVFIVIQIAERPLLACREAAAAAKLSFAEAKARTFMKAKGASGRD
jgi:hypothetical protein